MTVFVVFCCKPNSLAPVTPLESGNPIDIVLDAFVSLRMTLFVIPAKKLAPLKKGGNPG